MNSPADATADEPSADWGFLTSHARVLVCIAGDPEIRLRDIAAALGITERAVHRVLTDLVDGGYVLREKRGRRNRYEVVHGLPLRDRQLSQRQVGDLLEVLIDAG